MVAMQTSTESSATFPIRSLTRSKALARLVVTAAVASASLLTAQAALIYSGVQNVSITGIISEGSVDTLSVDLDFAGGMDLSLSYLGHKSSIETRFSNQVFDGVNFVRTPTRFVGSTGTPGFGIADKLAASTAVGPGSVFLADNGGIPPVTQAGISDAGGQWAPGDTGYLGFLFNPTGSQVLYGWGQVSVSGDGQTMTLVDWAYDNSGAAISAGVAAAPEPTSAVLCLLGAASLTLRRRRPASAAK